jgi:hypothetical protein
MPLGVYSEALPEKSVAVRLQAPIAQTAERLHGKEKV